MGHAMGADARAADIACRFGGDEFVVLLPRTEADAARALGERFQVRLRESCAFASPPFPWGNLTVTIDIASHPGDGDFATIEDLIRVADCRGGRRQALGPAGPLVSSDLQPVAAPVHRVEA